MKIKDERTRKQEGKKDAGRGNNVVVENSDRGRGYVLSVRSSGEKKEGERRRGEHGQ